MNSNQRIYNTSNEQLLLIDILNSMYNDNLRQITSLTDSNRQIRNLIVQILDTNNNNNINNSNNTNTRRSNSIYRGRRANNAANRHLNEIIINSMPYTIGGNSAEQFIIPTTRTVNLNNNDDFSQLLRGFFDPIEVYPTQTQIETATRQVKYCDIVSPKNTSCPISLNNFNNNDMVTVIRHCSHIFNTDELRTWFRNHCNCPVCRYDIREDNSTASAAFSQENHTNSNNTTSSTSINQNNTNNTSLTVNTERNNNGRGMDSFVNGYINLIETELLDSTDTSNNNFSRLLELFRQQLNNRGNQS